THTHTQREGGTKGWAFMNRWSGHQDRGDSDGNEVEGVGGKKHTHTHTHTQREWGTKGWAFMNRWSGHQDRGDSDGNEVEGVGVKKHTHTHTYTHTDKQTHTTTP